VGDFGARCTVGGIGLEVKLFGGSRICGSFVDLELDAFASDPEALVLGDFFLKKTFHRYTGQYQYVVVATI
jgi:hypothetical protein